jgi:hypothetical protein
LLLLLLLLASASAVSLFVSFCFLNPKTLKP